MYISVLVCPTLGPGIKRQGSWVFICFEAVVRVRVYYCMLTSSFSLFYVTGDVLHQSCVYTEDEPGSQTETTFSQAANKA